MADRPDTAYLGINRTLLLMFVLAVGIFFIAMPLYMDDFWFMMNLKPWLEGVPGVSAWDAVVETWSDRLASDNSRLANIFFVPFLLLPKWVGAAVAAIMFGVVVVWSLRICGVDVSRSPLTAIALFLWSFCLPWYDTMGAMNYQFNYFYALFFATLALKIFLSGGHANRWLLLIAGFLVGAWHEGFSAPLIGSFVILLIFYPAYRTTGNKFLLAGLFAGMIWLVSWPCAWNRTANVLAENNYGFSHFLYIAALHPAVFLAALCSLIALSRHRWRSIFKEPVMVLLLLNIAASFTIHFFTLRSPRSGFWAENCAVLTVVHLLARLFPAFARAYNPRRLVFLVPLILVVLAHWLLVDVYSVRIRRSFDSAVQEWKQSSRPYVFAEVLDEHSSPLICMMSPDFTTLLAPVSLSFADFYLNTGDGRQFVPVPRELRDFTPAETEAIPSDTLDIRLYKDRLVMPTTRTRRGEFLADVDFGYTVRHNVRMIYYPFVSEADSMTYAFVYPWRSVIDMRLGEIKSVTPLTNP